MHMCTTGARSNTGPQYFLCGDASISSAEVIFQDFCLRWYRPIASTHNDTRKERVSVLLTLLGKQKLILIC